MSAPSADDDDAARTVKPASPVDFDALYTVIGTAQQHEG